MIMIRAVVELDGAFHSGLCVGSDGYGNIEER